MIHLTANSYNTGFAIIGAMHRASNQEDADLVRSLMIKHRGRRGFYYPTDLGLFLKNVCDVDNMIMAHSGRTLINGEYVD